MKQKLLLTRTCRTALLVLALALTWGFNAKATHTINVMSNSAVSGGVYLYAWDDSDNELTDPWPGTLLTSTVTEQNVSWFTKTFPGVSHVNFIINLGGSNPDATKTPDLATHAGTANGTYYYEYDPSKYPTTKADNLTDIYDLPAGVTYSQSDNCVYFLNVKQWSEPIYCHFWRVSDDSGTTWPGGQMTRVGTNSNGWDIYKWTDANPTGAVDKKFIIHDNRASNDNDRDHRSPELVYTHNDIISGYDYSKLGNVSSERDGSLVYNIPQYFPDDNMRSAIESDLGVPASSSNVYDIAHVIAVKSVKILDISGHGITDPTGIERLTELEELYATDNNIKYIDLQNQTKLRILDLHNNENLLGFGIGTPGTSNNVARLPSGCLEYINMSNTRLRNYAQAAFADKVKNTLETFIARDVYYTTDAAKLAFQSIPSVTSLTKLKHIDVSGCDGTPASIVSTFSATQKAMLEYLDISNQHMSSTDAAPALNGFTALKTFKFGSQSGWTKSLSITGCTALEEIDLTGNISQNGLTINNCNLTDLSVVTGLSTLAALTSLNLDNNNLTDINFGIDNFTKLATLSVANNKLVNVTVPLTPNTLRSIDMSNNSLLESVTANHDQNGTNSKLRYIEVDGCPALTNFTMTGCDLYYNTQDDYLNATNNPNLVTMNLSDDAIISADIAIRDFQYLTNVNLSNNSTWAHGVAISNCPALTTVDVENNTSMTMVQANNGGYGNSNYPLVKTTADMNLSLYFNQNNFSAIPAVTSGVKYLYLQENAFAQDLTLDGDAIALKGIALSNKSGVSPIKTFTASVASTTPDEWSIDYTQTPPVMVCTAAGDASNTTLEAINLSGNSSLEEIKVNGFKALTKLASGTDMTTAAGKGLYVKSLGGLKKLDVSGNRIEILGQDGSLSGLSGLEELDASHNVIRTLTNCTDLGTGASLRSAYGNGKYTATTCPNIEDLTGLKKLNLSYNNLCDSVHLWKNTNLEWLDVSHNRVITERNAGQTLYYRDSQDGIFKPWKESAWKVVVDAYNGDTNDTIGLRMLDLFYQQNHLKYLDVSETNIMNTAMNHTYMNNRQGPESLTTLTTADSGGHPVGRHGVPHFVLVNHCEALETLLCNNNGMKSLGIGSVVNTSTHVTGCPNLKYLEAQGMRGQDPAIMQCELRISANNPLMEHYDVSGSNFDYIGLAEGATGEHLRYINVSDNYKSQNVYTDNGDGTWSTVIDGKRFTVHGNPYELNISNLPVLDSLIACNAPHLQVVKAHNMPNFEVIDLTQDMASNDLRELYVDHNAKLDNVVGLETLNHLEVYHTNDSHFTGEFVMPVAAKSTLKDLRVSNEALSYAATRNNLTEVDIDGYHLERFDVQNNPAITSIKNSTSATTMKHLDFANCHIDNSGIDEITGMTALEYFNASNDAAADGVDGNWLMDLDLHSSPNIQEIHANNNELYAITVPATATNLTVVEYANNHVNGADFSGVPSSATINSVNNGRQIKANKSTFVKNGTTYDLYFFQLDESQAGEGYGGSPLKTQQTRPTLHSTADLRQLDTDGFDLQKVSWQAGTTVQGGKQKANAIAGADDVDASKIYGTIVVLDPSQTSSRDASLSSMSYDYQNGNGSMSNYYLDYSASDVVTAIDEINTDGKVPAVRANGMGSIIVSGEPGAVLGLYDMSGRLVQKVVIGDDGSTTVDGLSPGVYVIGGEKVRL